jgi:hypothetical protein
MGTLVLFIICIAKFSFGLVIFTAVVFLKTFLINFNNYSAIGSFSLILISSLTDMTKTNALTKMTMTPKVTLK